METRRFAKVTDNLIAKLGKPIGSARYVEAVLIVGPKWVMTRQDQAGRKEWFVIEECASGFSLVCGKIHARPLLDQDLLDVEWVTDRTEYELGSVDKISWNRRGKKGQAQVATLKAELDCEPSLGKHWIVLQALEPMLLK